MKHLPFQSVYRSDFEVVEQREGNVRFYPHTAQLPILLRAINMEFYGGLPDRIARVDHRANGFDKIVLKSVSQQFCATLNGGRADQLRLFAIPDRNLVFKIAIVQQITEMQRRGPCHRFRFYAGDDFFPEIYLSGKSVVVADHVLQRFSTRVPNNIGEDLSYFLLNFFGGTGISLPVPPGRALVFPCSDSIAAFTYKESKTEFFITTCLTVKEIHSLGLELPPLAVNPHYDLPFTTPKVRHWMPTQWMLDFYKCWERKTPFGPPFPQFRPSNRFNWHWLAHKLRDTAKKKGHGPGSRMLFVDHIVGPHTLDMTPVHQEPRFDELKIYKTKHPEDDWDSIFAERYGESQGQPSD